MRLPRPTRQIGCLALLLVGATPAEEEQHADNEALMAGRGDRRQEYPEYAEAAGLGDEYNVMHYQNEAQDDALDDEQAAALAAVAASARQEPGWSQRRRTPHPHFAQRRKLAERNVLDLKRRHLEIHGFELTDLAIDDAIAEARANTPPQFAEGHPMRVSSLVPGFEDHHEPHPVHPVSGRKLQLVQTTDAGILVSALSPGWDWNYGRNEFYCVAFDEIHPPFIPLQNGPLTMLDCYKTRYEQITLNYTADFELLFDRIDGVYWDWCASTTDLKKGKVRVAKCDIQQPLQQWSLLDAAFGDGTWRPIEDDFKCVTGRPPRAGRTGGGKLKLMPCTSRSEKREAQTFLFCQDTADCEIVEDTDHDSKFIECVIETECTGASIDGNA